MSEAVSFIPKPKSLYDKNQGMEYFVRLEVKRNESTETEPLFFCHQSNWITIWTSREGQEGGVHGNGNLVNYTFTLLSTTNVMMKFQSNVAFFSLLLNHSPSFCFLSFPKHCVRETLPGNQTGFSMMQRLVSLSTLTVLIETSTTTSFQ